MVKKIIRNSKERNILISKCFISLRRKMNDIMDKKTPRMGEIENITENKIFSAGSIDENMLTEEDKNRINQYANEVNITDAKQVLSFGSSAQRNISDFSVTILKKVKTRDLGEVGDALKNLTVALNSTTEPQRKGLRGLFQKAKRGVEAIKADFARAESNVKTIERDLENHQVALTQDIAMFDQLYELNRQYYKELTLYIIAGKRALEKAKSEDLEDYKEKAEETQLQEDIQAYNDFLSMCNRFEKKIHDLELTRTVCIQTVPQIRMLQANDQELLEKIQSSITNTIPLWRHQIVIALGLEHSARALAAQNAITETTNELLMENSEKLKIASIETAKESERAVIDIETLEKRNADLIYALNEVVQIHEEGSKKRKEAEIELQRIEDELKTALLEIGNK